MQPPEPEPYCGCVPSEDSYLWSSLDGPLACSLREEEDAAYDPLPFGDSLSMICRVEQQGQVRWAGQYAVPPRRLALHVLE